MCLSSMILVIAKGSFLDLNLMISSVTVSSVSDLELVQIVAHIIIIP